MSEIAVRLENKRFWDAANKARKAMPLSQRSVAMLEACRGTTFEKPLQEVSFARARHLMDKGLLDFRMFDKKLGAGGHFITAAGEEALRLHYSA